MGIQCSRALSELILDWNLLFSWLELADLFRVHNLSCSLFLVFHFSFHSCISLLASPLLLKPSSVSLETISTDPLHCCPWLEPPSQILGKNQLTTFQEASTWLSKPALQKTNPWGRWQTKKNKTHMCHPNLMWSIVRPRECQIELGKVKQSWIHPDFWTMSHNYRGKWCMLLLLHTAHTH